MSVDGYKGLRVDSAGYLYPKRTRLLDISWPYFKSIVFRLPSNPTMGVNDFAGVLKLSLYTAEGDVASVA